MTFSFGSTATPSTGGGLFGSTSGTTSLFGNKSAASTTPSLGTTNTVSAGTLFGVQSSAAVTTTASTGGLFGAVPAASSATSTTSLFGTNNLSANTATSSTSSSLFATTSTAAAAPSLFNTAANKTGGLFGSTATATPAAPSLFGGTAAATPAASKPEETVTLGGIRSDTAKTTGPKAWRNETVPEPVCKLVDEMKKFLKEQKELKDGISRFSPASIDKVKEEIEFLTKSVRYLARSLTTDTAAVSTLKTSVTMELKNCEIAQRTKDSTNLPFEISQPMEYFHKLVSQFEEAIQAYKVQIDEIESVMTCDSNSVTTANIGATLSRMHQIFVALASKIHTLHEDIKLQKDFYLNFRKVLYKDESNIFEIRKKGRIMSQVCPTPFSDSTGLFRSNVSGS